MVLGLLMSGGLQVVKDRLNLNAATLRYVAIALGAVAGGIVAAQQGVDGVSNILALLGAGALITPGAHSALQQKTVIGEMLKAIGAALFRPEAK